MAEERDEGRRPEDEAPGAEPEEQPAGEQAPEGEGGEQPSPEGRAEAPGPEVEGAEQLEEAAQGAERTGAPEEPAAEEEEPAAAAQEGPAAEPQRERPRRERRRRRDEEKPEEEVIPGADLEPDLVLEEEARRDEDEFGEYAALEEAPAVEEEPEEAEEAPAPEPVVREPLDLAADARYIATGKRKTAVARVILKPGDGTYTVNGRALIDHFPRVKLQRMARQPLEAAGYQNRLDVMARIQGGGVSAQAGALRHGVARALVEADPNLRGELKRRGFLTRDPREKERKKAGLKKARKRPQFSKR